MISILPPLNKGGYTIYKESENRTVGFMIVRRHDKTQFASDLIDKCFEISFTFILRFILYVIFTAK